jgi:hypothetical protein
VNWLPAPLAQNVTDAHETTPAPATGIADDPVHPVPFHVKYCPKPTAMQKVAEVQLTPPKRTDGAIGVGLDQPVSLHFKALPSASTAMQNVAVGHDTPVSSTPPSIRVGAVQLVPFHSKL